MNNPLRKKKIFNLSRCLTFACGLLIASGLHAQNFVQVYVSNLDVTVTGTSDRDIIHISQTWTNDGRAQFSIDAGERIEFSGDWAYLNRYRYETTYTLELDNIIDDMRIYAGGGRDEVYVDGFEARGANGDLLVDMGEGNDIAVVTNADARQIHVLGQDGEDELTIRDSEATSWLVIRGHEGQNDMLIDNCTTEYNMSIRGGSSDDIIVASHCKANSLLLRGYGGDDDIEYDTEEENSFQSVSIVGDAGLDDVLVSEFFEQYTARSISISTGDDDDTLTMISRTQPQVYWDMRFDTCSIDLGSGFDSLEIPGLRADSLTIRTGSGGADVEASLAGSEITIIGSDEKDLLSLDFWSAGSVTIDTFADEDRIEISDAGFGSLVINSGRHDDFVEVGSMWGGLLQVTTGQGADYVILGTPPWQRTFELDEIDVQLGTGNDIFENAVSGSVSEMLIDGGPGIDYHYWGWWTPKWTLNPAFFRNFE